MKFKNPTSKSKAVKVKGGAVVLKPNTEKTIEGKWSEDEMEKMRAAGLVISGKAVPQTVKKDEGAA